MIRPIVLMLACVMLCSTIIGCTKKPANDHPGDNDTPIPVITVQPADSEQPETDEPTASETPVTTDDESAAPVDTTEPATPDASDTDAPATAVVTSVPSAAPTAVPSAVPTSVPATTPPNSGSNYVSIGTSTKPARFTMPTDLYGVSEANCEAWFSDAVFCGDSLTLGWKNYNNRELANNPNFFGQTHFLCEGSYGVGHAFDPISGNSLHPVYAGEQHYLWDSISMMHANKVFLLFGLNDLSIYGVEGTSERFDQLTDNIRAASPNAQIFIISAMYMYKGSEREKLNNRNLYLLNQNLVSMCNRKNYEFINIASHLIDENGFVLDQYSSDHYVHQTYAAYEIWAEILRSTAARHIKGMSPIVFTLPQ